MAGLRVIGWICSVENFKVLTKHVKVELEVE